jgi:hypothetical protein
MRDVPYPISTVDRAVLRERDEPKTRSAVAHQRRACASCGHSRSPGSTPTTACIRHTCRRTATASVGRISMCSRGGSTMCPSRPTACRLEDMVIGTTADDRAEDGGKDGAPLSLSVGHGTPHPHLSHPHPFRHHHLARSAPLHHHDLQV